MTISRSLSKPFGCQTCHEIVRGENIRILWASGKNFDGQSQLKRHDRKGDMEVSISLPTTTTPTTTTKIPTATDSESVSKIAKISFRKNFHKISVKFS